MGAKFLIIPNEAEAELLELLLLDVERLGKLRAVLGDKKASSDGHAYQRVARALDVGNEQALKLLSATSNIRAQRERFGLSDEDLYSDLLSFVEGTEGERDERYRKALLDLLARTEDEYFIQRVSSLRHALVPHIVDSRTIVDARPIFDKERTKVEGFLLVAHL